MIQHLDLTIQLFIYYALLFFSEKLYQNIYNLPRIDFIHKNFIYEIPRYVLIKY